MATIDELERRVRFVESEVEGEKAVTRSVYEQSVRNGDQLGALRSEVATARVDIQAMTSRVDHVAQEVVQNTAALRNHGTLLTILQQDVTALRGDAIELRRGQEAINARLDGMDVRLDRMESSIATILAAVTPRGSA
jgi:chromosome segregation ATPase